MTIWMIWMLAVLQLTVVNKPSLNYCTRNWKLNFFWVFIWFVYFKKQYCDKINKVNGLKKQAGQPSLVRYSKIPIEWNPFCFSSVENFSIFFSFLFISPKTYCIFLFAVYEIPLQKKKKGLKNCVLNLDKCLGIKYQNQFFTILFGWLVDVGVNLIWSLFLFYLNGGFFFRKEKQIYSKELACN